MSTNSTIALGNLDMLRSMYDFKATYAKTLSFKANEYFVLHQLNTKHKNWWEVINEKGETGFIPSNYVQKVTVSPGFYMDFLDNATGHLERNPDSYDKKEVVLRLQEIKKLIKSPVELEEEEAVLPPPLFRNEETNRGTPNSNTSFSSNISDVKNEVHEEPIRAIEKPSLSQKSIRKSIENIHEELRKEDDLLQRRKSEAFNTKVSPQITKQSVYELVESVRINTQLSHEMSKVAVQTVIHRLHDFLPAVAFPYLSTILSYCDTSLVADDVQIEQTHDASRLKIILNELTSCKEDSQQRSWMLHEDEAVIKEYLSELISILTNADASISRHVISFDQYHVINTLIQYYQMEVRWSIRQLLLQAFGVLCSLDRTVISIMLNSVLPGELARDMLSNPRNIPKLNYSALLLTMIFSMGEPMPITHLELLGEQFLAFVLNNIESPPDTDVDDQIPDIFLNVIVSFNLQFASESDNPVMKALTARNTAKIFTEKILLLLNREEDPVRIFDHEPSPPHSLLKLFLDLFNNCDTADLFYTNDTKVLIDIIVRNITDLCPGDPRRHQYLELSRRVMKTTNYNEHLHRRDEILKCFTRIFCEETEQSRSDQSLIKQILNEFPQYFK